MTNQNVDVLIVGAGPTGLTLACELARHGVSFRIIDKLSIASDKSKALAIHSRSLEVFEDMGIVERFLTYGLKVHGVNIYADTKQIARLSLDELEGYYSFALTLPQSDTERILMERLTELGHAVERSLDLVALNQTSNGVESTVKNEEGIEQVIKTRWVVGCDGAHSAVRKLLKLEFTGTKYPELVYLGDCEVEGALNDDEIYVFNSDKGLLAFFPYGGSRYRIAALMGEQKEQQITDVKTAKEPTIEELQAIVDDRSIYELKLSNQHWSSSLYIHCRHVSHYRVDNCFLAGDAAHIHSPAGGQGMNTGIQDSYNLAWKMGLVAKNISSDALLDSYDSERLAIALGVLKMTDFMTRVQTMKNPIAKSLRNTLAPILTAQEVVQKRIKNNIAELSLNYRQSPIVEEHLSSVVKSFPKKQDMPTVADCFEFINGPESGDRAPDGYLTTDKDEPIRLYEMLKGTKHVLLMFSGDETSDAEIEMFKAIASDTNKSHKDLVKVLVVVDSDESRKRCEPHFADLKAHAQVVTDWEMSTHHKYGAGSNCMYLIRPDNYVGFRSQPIEPELFADYLNSIFDKSLSKIK